jgi:hypothetical protein
LKVIGHINKLKIKIATLASLRQAIGEQKASNAANNGQYPPRNIEIGTKEWQADSAGNTKNLCH